MKVSFFLTRPKAEVPTSIYVNVCYAGFKFKYYTPESVHPDNWDRDSQRVSQKVKSKDFADINKRLLHIDSAIRKIHNRYITDNPGNIPRPEKFRKLLDNEIRQVEPEEKTVKTFMSFFQYLIDQMTAGVKVNHKNGKPYSINTIKTYVTTLNHLTAFNPSKDKLSFDKINIEFYNEFTEYLIKVVKLSSNSIGKDIKVIKAVLNEATEAGINTNRQYQSKKFSVIKEDVTNIYLNESELKEMGKLDLSGNKKLESTRDLFLIGAYSGLRYSDYSVFNPEKIKDGFIEILQAKTGNAVVIPIHPTVKQIIKKYNGVLPRAISNQKSNQYLKEVAGLIPSLQKIFVKTFTKGGLKIIENKRKMDLLVTHSARRSFATNEYIAGTPSITIMAITGHKTESSFMKYIKLSPNEHAKLMKLHWDQRNQLKAV